MRDVYEVIDILKVQMSAAASALSEEGLESAVDSAIRETGWTFPLTDPKKIYWILERSKRHACYILWVASAQKFKYKQVNLQQRFEHYEKLIKQLDSAYEAAQTAEFSLFANTESYKMFGSVVGAGFAYGPIGEDLTYAKLVRYINTGE